MKNYIFTSESVSEGHPDKVCDQISDAVLDAILTKDKNARVAIETFAANGLLVIGGEVSTTAYVDAQKIARKTIKEIGYTDPAFGIDYDHVGILLTINEQSPDIAQGVNQAKKEEQGAGDQGLMFGFACNETKELMPLPISLAHKLTKKLAEVRKNKELKYLRPDTKSQVAVEYIDGKPVGLKNVVIATQHDEDVDMEKLREDIKEKVILPVCGDYIKPETEFFINMTGKFVIGGPQGDTGLTGRKIIVDTYGGMGRHGGGCFSGKDPSKVDRSGAYMARYTAKNIVAAGLADKCEVQISYVIGRAEPTSIHIDCFGTEKTSIERIEEVVQEVFDFRPGKIIENLGLLDVKYLPTASYGHFGRDGFPWEKTDKVDELRRVL